MADEKQLIPGLSHIPYAISINLEQDLLDYINSQEWHSYTPGEREVQHYGYKYKYTTRQIDRELPTPIPPLFQRVASQLNLDSPNQIIVNKYLPGQGITAHVDHRELFDEEIASLTLQSGAMMTLKNICSKKKVNIYLQPRSLIKMTCDARHKWTHQIDKRKSDTVGYRKIKRGTRISLTYRKVKNEIIRQLSS